LLEHTFIHIKGIGRKTEQRLWEQGIRTWRDFQITRKTILSPSRDRFIRSELEVSVKHMDDIRFFRDRLSSGDMWRLFAPFKDRAVYLDIETNGGYQGVDEITVIGLYDGTTVQTFVNGINLDEFEMAIAPFELVVTFNGATFDLPIIRRWFRNISLPPAHIDLRYVLKSLGYSGGLKRIEKDLNIFREPEIDGMDGYEAVRLWEAYEWGDTAALDRLIQYNSADIMNLEPLMDMAYREMKARLLCFMK
jgi:uncharacterized protein YprB with RNaseH-like and TPR domain